MSPRVLRTLGPAVLAPGCPPWSRLDTVLGLVHVLHRTSTQKLSSEQLGRGRWPEKLNKHVTFLAIKSN